MFKGRVKELESEVSKLRERNHELVGILEASANEHSTDFVVKLIPDCSEHFFINGSFVVDESRAVYGAHQLSFSEAVCWKAGKEVAKRAYEQLIKEAEDKATVAETSAKSQDSKAAGAEEFVQTLQAELAESRKAVTDLQNQVDSLERGSEVLRNTVDSLTEEKLSLQALLETYKQKFEAASEQLSKLTEFTPSDNITTSYGVVTVGSAGGTT